MSYQQKYERVNEVITELQNEKAIRILKEWGLIIDCDYNQNKGKKFELVPVLDLRSERGEIYRKFA